MTKAPKASKVSMVEESAAPDITEYDHTPKPIPGTIEDLTMTLIDEPAQDVRSYISEEHIHGLAESMRAIGLIHEPIAVRVGGRFEIVSGHCRFLAARALGWDTLRCKVVSKDEVDREFMKLHENLFRQDLSAMEKARALHINKLRFDLTDDDLARRFGHSRPWVTRILGALGWPEDLQEANSDGVLGFEVCDMLRKVKDPKYRATLIKYAVADGCSKRLAAQWYNEWLRNERMKENLKAQEQNPDESALVQSDDQLAADALRQQQEYARSKVAALRKKCNLCGGDHLMEALMSWDLCPDCIGLLNNVIGDAKLKGATDPSQS